MELSHQRCDDLIVVTKELSNNMTISVEELVHGLDIQSYSVCTYFSKKHLTKHSKDFVPNSFVSEYDCW